MIKANKLMLVRLGGDTEPQPNFRDNGPIKEKKNPGEKCSAI